MDRQECIIRDATLEEMMELMKAIAAVETPGKWSPQIVADYLSKSDIHLVAECDGQIVGSVTAASEGMLGKKMPILDFVNVLRSHHRRGIGSRLATAAINRLVAAGKSPIHCTVVTPASHKFVHSLPAELRTHLLVEQS